MTDQVTLNIQGQRVKVDPSFLQLSPEEQEATVEEIAQSLNVSSHRSTGAMGQVNQGIAESVGGVVDFLNPFDTPTVSQAIGMGDRLTTGSAVSGLERVMDASGVTRASGAPQTGSESFSRGVGQAAGALLPAGASARVLSGVGGVVGRVAADASRTINTGAGAASELLAGGAARASQDAAERAGAPEWAQQAAGIAGGVATAAVPYVAARTPTALGARHLGKAVQTAAMPYTETGAQEVARQRVQSLAGGQERSAELAARIGDGSDIGLTPAQITEDPNMLALEQTAARQDPLLRERLVERAAGSRTHAADALPGAGGDVEATQSFFEERRRQALNSIAERVERATQGALRPEARHSASQNSEAVADQLRRAESAADAEEARLWAQVPMGAQVGTTSARRLATEVIQSTPRAQQDDIPRKVRELLGPGTNDGFGDFETVSEMHGLYSELRRIARSAMAGNDQNRNMARIANSVADAVLDDLGAHGSGSEIGRTIDAARAFSAAKHETFDQGTVGKLLRRTLDGDEAIDPRLTLDRTLGRGGTAGMVAYDDITRAADTSPVQSAAEDFLVGQYDRAAFKPDGSHNPNGARKFLRDNAEVLQRMPHLREVLVDSLRTQQRAASLSGRGARVLQDTQNPSKSAITAFSDAAPEQAVDQVFKARHPIKEAVRLVRTARKDKSGAALGGLKAAFSAHLIRQSGGPEGLSGTQMQRFLENTANRRALAAAFSGTEVRRMDTIARQLRKLETAQKATPDIGGLSNRSPNRVIEIVGRVAAARHGAQLGGGAGGSIQTAGMLSGRAKQIMQNLQNDKAEQLLIDAIEDPQLFRVLLMDPGRISPRSENFNRLAPYLTGAMAGTEWE